MKINKLLSIIFLVLIFSLFGCNGTKQLNDGGLNSVNGHEELKSLLTPTARPNYYYDDGFPRG
ncbi:MAG: hypothetical protein PHT03_04230, partial [Bacilli bacterium]|nr:hypothetical protein [Bacilli bacterium]